MWIIGNKEGERPFLETNIASFFRFIVFSVTIIVRVLLRVFDRITGLNPGLVDSSSSSIRG